MKKFIQTSLFFLMVMMIFQSLLAQTSKDNYTGLWTSNSTWTTGVAPATTIPDKTMINIDGFVTRNGDLTISGNSKVGGQVVVFDTLWIAGDLTIIDNGTLTIQSAGVLVVTGNVYLNERSQLINYGNTVIKSNLSLTNKGELTNNPGPGEGLYIYGTTTNTSKVGFTNGSAPIQNEQDLVNNNPPLLEFAGSTTPLPIELLYFKGEVTRHTVQLSWATAMEDNFDTFTLERAGDDMIFLPVATLKGSGFSHEAIDYHFTDQQPLTGMNFYRLKATDLDGKVAYHKVISVWVDEVPVSHVTLYPNPLRDSHELFIAATSTQTLQVTVADFFGNIIINTSVSGGKNMITLPDNIKPGSYLVSVALEDGSQHHIRLIIQ